VRTPGDRAGTFDLRNANDTSAKRLAIGKGLRQQTPAIVGYSGNSDVLDKALATWAEAYGEQTEPAVGVVKPDGPRTNG